MDKMAPRGLDAMGKADGTYGLQIAGGKVLDWIAAGSSGGGSGGVETYDAAISAALTGAVHRWKFDETSGTSVADSIGSLNLTLSGTVTRHVASPTGFATTFGASSQGVSSGLGSLPVGNNDRCFIVLFRTTSEARQEFINYGPTGSTRQQFFGGMYISGGNVAYLQVWSDDINTIARTVRGPIPDATSGTDWHLMAFGYKASALTTYVYYDGMLISHRLGGTLNTGTSGNLVVGSSGNPFLGDLDDILVLNNWPGKAKLDRLLAAAAGLVYYPG